MWELKEPNKVKLIIGIMAADEECLKAAVEMIEQQFGKMDFKSDAWPFNWTKYYEKQTGTNILKQFVSIDQLIHPGDLATIKHKTNEMEQQLAIKFNFKLPRPVNLDPGIIEPSKLILATTKNYAHRIYIGQNMFAEVTLIYDKGTWKGLEYTYPDYKSQCYWEFFDKVRYRLLEQLK